MWGERVLEELIRKAEKKAKMHTKLGIDLICHEIYIDELKRSWAYDLMKEIEEFKGEKE